MKSPFDNNPFAGDPFQSASDILRKEDPEESTFQNIFTSIGRGGYFVRDLLMGNAEGMARNAGQLLNEVSTIGGIFNRDATFTGILNTFLPEKYELATDFTRPEDRPEGSDLFGKPGDFTFWERLVLDVGVGMLTDPLTYLAPGGAQGAKALLGAPDDAARIAIQQSLNTTKAGSAKLASKTDELFDILAAGDEAAIKHATRISKGAESRDFLGVMQSDAWGRMSQDEVRNLLKGDVKLSSDVNRYAAQKIFEDFAGSSDDFQSLLSSRRLVDKGITKLVEEGYQLKPGRMYAKIPFFDKKWNIPGPLSDNMWSTIGRRFTIPGWASHGIRADPVAIEAAQEGLYVASEAASKVGKTASLLEGRTFPGADAARAGAQKAMAQAGQDIDKAELLFDKAKFGGGLADILPGKLLNTPEEFSLAQSIRKAWPRFLSWAGGSFWQRSLAGGAEIPKAFKDFVREKDGERLEGLKTTWDKITKHLGDMFPDGSSASHLNDLQRKVGDIYLETRDGWREALAKHLDEFGAETWDDLTAVQKAGFDTSKLDSLFDSRLLELADGAEANREAVKAFAYAYKEDMAAVAGHLKTRGVMDGITNPYYVMDQAEVRFADVLDQSLRKNLRTEVLEAAKYRHNKDLFEGALGRLKEKHGILDGDIANNLLGDADLVEKHMGSLWYRRMAAHHENMQRWNVMDEGKRLKLSGLTSDSVMDTYLSAQFQRIGGRESMFFKILGGGSFENAEVNKWAQRQAGGSEFKEWLQEQHKDPLSPWSYTKKDGVYKAKYRFKGLNAIYKPALTVANPSFHIRNLASGAVMAHMDEMIRAGGPRKWGSGPVFGHTFLSMTENVPILNLLHKAKGWGKSETATFVRALGDDMGDAAKAVAELGEMSKKGLKFGRYSADEAYNLAKEAIGFNPSRGNMGRADLIDELNQSAGIVAQLSNAKNLTVKETGNYYTRYINMMAGLSERMETTMRTTALLNMLQKGVGGKDAIRRVNRMFIDYSRVSTVERQIRDVVPFAKFAIGSIPWLKNMAEAGGAVGGLSMGRAIQSLSEGELEASGSPFLPKAAMDGVSFLFPGLTDKKGHRQLVTSFGLPQESTLKMLAAVDALFSPVTGEAPGFRSGVLGGIQPVLRFPLEAATGNSLFFGSEFGKFRKAPPLLKAMGLTQEVKLPDGSVRHEISGNSNEILNALPTATMMKWVGRWFDDKNLGHKLTRNLTGVRTMTVDHERELKKRIATYMKDKAKRGQVGETLVYFERMDESTMPEDLKILMQNFYQIRKLNTKRHKEASGEFTGRYKF